ncbi:MAG: NAD(P)H-hydrate dehydratase [Mogibacterium sp.]|nr:NAD(P)H-hydrate dehydratase [Mogibacterium sp.]
MEYTKIRITENDVRRLLPDRPEDCQKGDFGYVALIGGSVEYSGAIRLAAMANVAMRSGAGVASVAAPESICPVIAGQILEATLIPLSETDGHLKFKDEELAKICRRYDVIAFGMGAGLSDETVKTVEYLLKTYDKTLIIDADGLNAMSKLDREIIRNSPARLVLTPHLKEFSRLSGMSIDEIREDPGLAAMNLAYELNANVLLKGSTTYVAGPDEAVDGRRVFTVDRGCPGMATAGSGDVLSGILSAICVNADELALAAAAGAYINGLAGETAERKRSDITMLSSDTAMCIAEAIEQIRRD